MKQCLVIHKWQSRKAKKMQSMFFRGENKHGASENITGSRRSWLVDLKGAHSPGM